MKIFGIGFHKTGTTSLDAALKTLGYKVCGAQVKLAKPLFENDLNPIWEMVKKYDAFHDNPWAVLYQLLDEKYPESKFILTYRDEEAWINSVTNHFGATHSEMRRYIYGVGAPKGQESIYLNRYRKHNVEVRTYFENRKEDLLEVCWEEGDGWQALADFLGCPCPETPFPHKNKALNAKVGKWVKKSVSKYIIKKK